MPTYTGISSAAFKHPLDSQAEQALRNVPGFDLVARKFVEFMAERPQFVYQMGNSIQVGPRQYASIYHIFRECVRDLDIYPEPMLFISQNPLVNASAFGRERPGLIINSGLLDLFNESELRSVLAHELGHVKCGHTTLNQMAGWVVQAIHFLGNLTLGISRLVTTGLILAFYEWNRKAELSADRAALLVMDDLNPVLHSMMKMAGGSSRFMQEANIDEFIRQSENYQNLDQDGMNQVYKFLLYNNPQGLVTHPFTVERVHYIRQWATSEEYRQIRNGNYQRSPTSEGAVNVSEETPLTDTEVLRRQIEQLQQEINEFKSKSEDS